MDRAFKVGRGNHLGVFQKLKFIGVNHGYSVFWWTVWEKFLKKRKDNGSSMTYSSSHSRSGQEPPFSQATPIRVPLAHLWRLRMELDLWKLPIQASEPVPGYRVCQWNWADQEDYAQVLFQSFVSSPDAEIISSFRTLEGCRNLVKMVASNGYFWSSATFLTRQGSQPTAIIQIMGDTPGQVTLHNIGVVEEHRGKGLGRQLLNRATTVLQQWGISRVVLEVTENNQAAVGLYRSMGFTVADRFAKPFVPRAPEQLQPNPFTSNQANCGEKTFNGPRTAFNQSREGVEAPKPRP